jgi:hypothetical protein
MITRNILIAAMAFFMQSGFAQTSINSMDIDCDLALHEMMRTPPEPTLHTMQMAPHVSKAGILFSAAVPGSGQLYARSWIKGLLFLGAEVALWVGTYHWNDEGDEIRTTFREYADAHWSESKWNTYYNSEVDPATHHLPKDNEGNTDKTQQYYEMIGKYDQFKQGWEDWAAGGPSLTEMRDYYETLRDDSNKAYKKASYCTMAILGNHLISALDAALTIHKMNAKAQMGMTITPTVGEPVMTTGVALSW